MDLLFVCDSNFIILHWIVVVWDAIKHIQDVLKTYLGDESWYNKPSKIILTRKPLVKLRKWLIKRWILYK